MKKNILFPLSLTISVVLFFTSCKKSSIDTETQSAIDNSFCEAEFSKIMATINEFASAQPGVYKLSSNATCPTVIIEPLDTLNGFPITMKLLYDSINGCAASDGVMRKGILEATFTKPWHPDTLGVNLVSIQLKNYYVNNIKYEGTCLISKPQANYFNFKVQNGKISKPNDWNLTWDSDRTMHWAQGQGDQDPLNDVYEISGTSSGINRKNLSYTSSIVTPLVKSGSCKYIQSGSVEITPDGLATRSIDYGSGACDNKAKLTISGNSFEINLN